MKRYLLRAMALPVIFMLTAAVNAETASVRNEFAVDLTQTTPFHRLSDRSDCGLAFQSSADGELQVQQAVWPFSKKEGENGAKPKSARKAFFLSLLVPGLGEAYVGSKRGFFFAGLEAVAWWMYFTNTNEGYDIEDDFRAFADDHWHYTDEDAVLGHSYWDWLVNKKYIKDDTIGPEDYDKIKEQLEDNADISVHHYSGRKDQQDYEMIGKYPQFIYGWEDINNENNPALRDENGNFNGNFNENISKIQSPLREEYEDMRYDSNKKLKAGQRGIHIMIVNRILSAVDAGRLAYHHNKKLESELSSVRIRLVQKQILDNKVTMLTLTKKF